MTTDNETCESSDIILPQKYVVCRPVYRSDDFKKEYQGSPPSPPTPCQKVKNYVRKSCTPSELLQTFLAFFPVFKWLPRYRISEWLLADILAGITIFVVQLPQGIAYGKIAGLTPMQGIYSSCFPLLSYFIMSDSKYLSVGPTMTTSILLASIISRHTINFVNAKSSNQTFDFINATESETIPTGYSSSPSPIEITVIITFVAGLYQILMGLLHLDFLFVYLSKPFVGGYILGTTLKLLIEELDSIFGIKKNHHPGPFDTIYFIIYFFQHITTINWVTTVISICSLIVMFSVRQYLSPYLQKKCKMPIPIELVVVIIGTVASKYLRLQAEWNVKTVGILQSGIPDPHIPRMELIPKVPLDSFIVAIVSLCFSLTINNIFSSKYNEEIDNNKEFVALGVSNIVSSLFSGMVIGGAISRSLIQEAVGGKTQIVGIITFIFFILSLLVMGQALEDLPECVLSAIIVVSFKDMLKTVRDVCPLWKSCKLDALVWLVAVLSTILIDLTNGLLIGLGFNLLVILYRTQKPRSYLLGVVPKTNIYVPLQEYEKCEELPNVKIFRFDGSLLCNSMESFAAQLAAKTNINVTAIAAKQQKAEKTLSLVRHGKSSQDNYGSCDTAAIIQAEDEIPEYVIIDCSAIGDMDTPGLNQLLSIYTSYRGIGIQLILASCNDNIYGMMKRSNFFETFPASSVYLSIHDAVLSIT